MSVEVISPGLWTTIQDRGRTGFEEYGVPEGGVMDRYSAKMANLLVGNPGDAALMEITMAGPKLKFNADALLAVTGINARIFHNGQRQAINEAFRVRSGDQIRIRQVTEGLRVYLAINGGFQTPEILGSRSFFRAITASEKIRKGDKLSVVDEQPQDENMSASVKFEKSRYETSTLTVFPGPEWGELSETVKRDVLQKTFSISQKNTRQAYQVKEKIKNNLAAILTQPVLPGTVQLTPAGNMIILMRDAQTTGGYPRILQLDRQSINVLAQKRQQDNIYFSMKPYPESAQ